MCTERTGPGRKRDILTECNDKKQREKMQRNNIQNKAREDSNVTTQSTQNGVDGAKMEWERWLFVSDVRIITYLFISHCESHLKAAKIAFSPNAHTVCFPSASFSSTQTMNDSDSGGATDGEVHR